MFGLTFRLPGILQYQARAWVLSTPLLPTTRPSLHLAIPKGAQLADEVGEARQSKGLTPLGSRSTRSTQAKLYVDGVLDGEAEGAYGSSTTDAGVSVGGGSAARQYLGSAKHFCIYAKVSAPACPTI